MKNSQRQGGQAVMHRTGLIIALGIALCAALPVEAQIAFRAAGAQIATMGSSMTVTIPAGAQAGDLAVLIVAGRPTNATQPSAPAGWTLRSSSLREVGTNDLKVMTFYRVLSGGDANPVVSVPSAWQGSAAGASGQIAVWSGVHTSNPFDTADVTGGANAATNWTPPGITTVTQGAQVVSAVATSDDNALTILTTQGFTGRMISTGYDTTAGGDHSVGLADKPQPTAGAVTMLTWRQTVNASDRWAGITFALRPTPLNAPPTVSLTSPASGAAFTAPATITLTANAVDSDGTITKVEFLHGGTNLIATVTTAPYTFDWTNVTAGSYSLTAKATDNQNGTTTSTPVNVSVNAVPQLYYIHPDHLNTPRMIANQAGTTVWKWDQQEPFGSAPPNDNPSGLGAFDFPLRLPGQYYDRETALHYNMMRDYDPSIGRYVESDPMGLLAGLNTYLYAVGDPLQFVDGMGLFSYKPGVPPASPVLTGLLTCIENICGFTFVVTATTNGHPVGSPHGRGLAADIRYPKPNEFKPDDFLCCASRCGAGFGLDEKKHPSPNSDGDHIHVQIPRGWRWGGRGDLPPPSCGPACPI